jgi:hypothetical protein
MRGSRVRFRHRAKFKIIKKGYILSRDSEVTLSYVTNFFLAQSEYKKRPDIFAKIIHMNLAGEFNLLKDTQPHYIYKPESRNISVSGDLWYLWLVTIQIPGCFRANGER